MGCPIGRDYDLILSLLIGKQGGVADMPDDLVHMRLDGESNRSFANILRGTKEDWYAISLNGVGGKMTLMYKNLRKIPRFIL